MTASFTSLVRSILVAGPLAFTLIIAPVAKADSQDDLSYAADRVADARAILRDLVLDYEEADLDALLGITATVSLGGRAGTIAASLNARASDDDVRLTRVKDAFFAFESTYASAVKRYDATLDSYCFQGPFAEIVGDALDEVGDDVWRVARALGIKVRLPRPALLEDVCGEIDGR